MHTLELLDEALAFARQAGYRIRQEWLGGNCGGSCVLRGRKWLFVDLDLGPAEQLEQALDALRGDPIAGGLPASPALRGLLERRATC